MPLPQNLPLTDLSNVSSIGRRLFTPKAAPRHATFIFVAVIFAFLLTPPPAPAQTATGNGNVLLEPSEQLFCILAAVNAAGYDDGIGFSAPGDVRLVVRDYLQAQNTPVLAQLKKFYADHEIKNDPGKNLGQ